MPKRDRLPGGGPAVTRPSLVQLWENYLRGRRESGLAVFHAQRVDSCHIKVLITVWYVGWS